MFEFEANESVVVESQKVLEAALSTNPKTQAVLRKMIRAYVKQARLEVVDNIQFKNGDPRGTRQAVRTTVYKKVLGANINIFNSRKAHGSNSYETPRKLRTGQRGGNRVNRSPKTQRMMSYAPLDRGMILRWQNSGTSDRSIDFTSVTGRRADKWNKHPNTGNRGSIAAHNFFRSLGDRAMGVMRDNLSAAIEEELTKLLNE